MDPRTITCICAHNYIKHFSACCTFIRCTISGFVQTTKVHEVLQEKPILGFRFQPMPPPLPHWAPLGQLHNFSQSCFKQQSTAKVVQTKEAADLREQGWKSSAVASGAQLCHWKPRSSCLCCLLGSLRVWDLGSPAPGGRMVTAVWFSHIVMSKGHIPVLWPYLRPKKIFPRESANITWNLIVWDCITCPK